MPNVTVITAPASRWSRCSRRRPGHGPLRRCRCRSGNGHCCLGDAGEAVADGCEATCGLTRGRAILPHVPDADGHLRENGVAMMLKREEEGVRTRVIWHFLATSGSGGDAVEAIADLLSIARIPPGHDPGADYGVAMTAGQRWHLAI